MGQGGRCANRSRDILGARDDIPLKPNYADDAHQKWVCDQCADKQVLVFERDGAVAGVVVLKDAEVCYLATSLAHRRSGVAGALIDEAKKELWTRYGVPACARADLQNVPVKRLFEKHGFVINHNKTDPSWIWFKTTEPATLVCK
jgi:ribosomal protein S18 acetylase RimI-like enzyme